MYHYQTVLIFVIAHMCSRIMCAQKAVNNMQYINIDIRNLKKCKYIGLKYVNCEWFLTSSIFVAEVRESPDVS